MVIDPYNGYRWLGYSFPEGIRADAVLVSHPHYDHDASYYFPPDVPVFRRPGSYQIGDLRITGVGGKHAEPYGREFGQTNTLWVVEVDGVRVAHLGDTGPLSREAAAALGRVDVLLIPVDGQDHILKREEIAAIRAVLRPRITVPMHYRIPALSPLPDSLGPVDPWLADQSGVRRLATHQATVSPAGLAKSVPVWVFPPSPEVRPWRKPLWDARAQWEKARELTKAGRAAEAAALLRKAVELAPEASLFAYDLARALEAWGRREEAVAVLERSLASSSRKDWEYTVLSRALLAGLYAAQGRTSLAAGQYRLVRAHSFWIEPRKQAKAFLSRLAADP